jgi:hypothetical protein
VSTGRRARSLLLADRGLVFFAMSGHFFSIVAFLLAGTIRSEARELVANTAKPPREFLHIEWQGSAACRPTKDVFEGLWRLLGGDPNSILTQELVVRATIGEQSRGWTLALSAVGSNGPIERTLSAPTCSEIAQAAALVISLWVQPAILPQPLAEQDEVGRVRPSAAADPETAPRAATEPRFATRVQLRRDSWEVGPERRLRLQLALGPTAFSGALPRWGWGITGRVGLVFRSWHADVLLVWLEDQQVWISRPAPLGGRFGLMASGIRVARGWSLASFLNAQPGIWALIGRLRGEAMGQGTGDVTLATPSNGGWGAFGLGLDSEWRIRRVILTLGAGGGLPFGRPRFFLGNELLYRTPPVTWFGHLQVATAFP